MGHSSGDYTAAIQALWAMVSPWHSNHICSILSQALEILQVKVLCQINKHAQKRQKGVGWAQNRWREGNATHPVRVDLF